MLEWTAIIENVRMDGCQGWRLSRMLEWKAIVENVRMDGARDGNCQEC